MATPPQEPPAGQEMPQPPAMPQPPIMPGQQPSPEQIAIMQRQLAAEAEKHGMSVPQFVEQLKRQAFEQNMRRMAAMQQQQAAAGGAPGEGGPPPGAVPVQMRMTPNGPVAIGPNGEAIPVAIGPNGRPVPLRVGPNGQPIRMMMGPNGQPIPVQMGPNGQPIPVQMRPPSQGGQPGQPGQPEQGAPGGPSPQQLQQMQMQRAMQQQQQQQARQQQAGPRPIVPGPPNPAALAVAKFLRGQSLKPRTVILNGERKDMFKVKRALRALQSPAYEKARKKNPLLPEITDRASLENTFKLLPMSMLALRVGKSDPHAGHNHGNKKTKRIKGQWTVSIIQQQDAADDLYYVWLWEGSQVMRKVYAALALVLIFLVVLYPLWPLKLRQGVYYLSWGFLGLLGLFFAMAIFRVILFCITYFLVPPGLWLYPNLWEDVSFMDSFRPVWAWHDPNPKKKKKKSKTAPANAEAHSHMNATIGHAPTATATTTATDTQVNTATNVAESEGVVQRTAYSAPEVQEVAE